MVKYRYWSFLLVCVACLTEAIGYALRCLSSRVDPYRIAFFVGQYFCITCAPVFISSSVFFYLSRLLEWANTRYAHGHTFAPLGFKPRTLLWIFVGLDATFTVLQIGGAAGTGNCLHHGQLQLTPSSGIGVKTSKQKDPATVNDILIAGLAAQLVSFMLFLTVLISLYIRLSQVASHSSEAAALWREKSTTSLVIILACFLLLIRTAFRLAESAQGVFGYLSSHEAFFIALEMVPILVALALLIFKHPGKIFGPGRIIAKDGLSA